MSFRVAIWAISREDLARLADLGFLATALALEIDRCILRARTAFEVVPILPIQDLDVLAAAVAARMRRRTR